MSKLCLSHWKEEKNVSRRIIFYMMSSYQFKKYRSAKIISNGLKAIEKKNTERSKGNLNTVNII